MLLFYHHCKICKIRKICLKELYTLHPSAIMFPDCQSRKRPFKWAPGFQTLKFFRLWTLEPWLVTQTATVLQVTHSHLFQLCHLSYFCKGRTHFLMLLDMLLLWLKCLFISSPPWIFLVVLQSFPSCRFPGRLPGHCCPPSDTISTKFLTTSQYSTLY